MENILRGWGVGTSGARGLRYRTSGSTEVRVLAVRAPSCRHRSWGAVYSMWLPVGGC